jgi:hypothetical protein
MREKILISAGVAALLTASVALPQTSPPEAVRVRHAALELSIDYPAQKLAGSMTYDLEDLLSERLDGWTGRPATDTWVLNTLKNAIASDSSVRTVPFIDYGPHKMSGLSYTVGNAMFEVLFDLVGQEEFNKIIGGYYQKFTNGGSTRDFIDFAKKTARLDLSTFFDDWMFTTRWTALVASASSMRDLTEHYRATTSTKKLSRI